MSRPLQHLRDRPLLDHLAVAQYHHLVGQLRHQRQIMADDQQCPTASLDRLQGRQHLHLHGGVQCGGRLVGDQNAGCVGQRRGDQRALAQSAGKLVRALACAQGRFRHTGLLQQLQHPFATACAIAPAVCGQCFLDLAADRAQRVQRYQCVLQNEADVLAA